MLPEPDALKTIAGVVLLPVVVTWLSVGIGAAAATIAETVVLTVTFDCTTGTSSVPESAPAAGSSDILISAIPYS